MSFPSPITGLKLRVSTGTDTYEQSITSASLGNNSMQIMPNTVVFNAFNTNPAGTIFTPSIVTSYGSDQLGNAVSAVSTPSVVANFIARKTTPNLSLAAFTNKSTTDSPFSLSVTTNSGGVLSYLSSDVGVATVNSSGLVTINGPGTTTISVSQAASLDGQFAAASVTQPLVVSPPVVLPTFGPFTLPSHELVYQNQTITRQLTPPTSNSSGAFTFTSSNTAVATISISGGVSSINVIGEGTTIITATQATSGIYASSSCYIGLDTVTGTIFGTIWRQLGSDIYGDAPYDGSGSSVSLSSNGNILAVGAVFNDGTTGSPADNRGHVKVYTRDKTVALGWTQLGGDMDGEAAADRSGQSVSLSFDGNIVAIGAHLNDGNGDSSGHVRVYKRDTNKTTAVTDQNSSNFGPVGWTRLGADIDGEAPADQSGRSVSLSSDGTTLAIGANFNDGNGIDSGHVRVYKYIQNTNTWVRHGGDIDSKAPGDQSGRSVSLSYYGTTLAIGAPNNDGNGDNSGHVRVYKYITDTWVQHGGDIDGEAAADQIGFSVSLSSDGNTVAIGASGNDGNGISSGHVRVYKYNPDKTDPQLNQSLPMFGPARWDRIGDDIDGEAAGDSSGGSVSLSSDGTIVAIGAINNDGTTGNSADNRGHVRVYIRDKSVPRGWTQLGDDIDGQAPGDNKGWFLSLSSDGKTLAIGATGNDGNGTTSGNVRVFKLE